MRDTDYRAIERQTLRFDRASVVKDFFFPQLFEEPRLFMAPIPEINIHYIPSLSIALQDRGDSVINCLRNKEFHDAIAAGLLDLAYDCLLFHLEEFSTYKEMAFVGREIFTFIRGQEPDCPLSSMKYSELRCCCWKDRDWFNIHKSADYPFSTYSSIDNSFSLSPASKDEVVNFTEEARMNHETRVLIRALQDFRGPACMPSPFSKEVRLCTDEVQSLVQGLFRAHSDSALEQTSEQGKFKLQRMEDTGNLKIQAVFSVDSDESDWQGTGFFKW